MMKKRITQILSFLLFSFMTCYGEGSKSAAEDLFKRLKPDLLTLFPDAYLCVTQIQKNMQVSDKISFHQINYVLTNVTTTISEKNLATYNEQLSEFFTWVTYWDTLNGVDYKYRSKSYPSTYAKPESPSIVPRINYTFSGEDEVYVDLNIDFISRSDSILIISCDLLLKIPEVPQPDLQIINPTFRLLETEGEWHTYELNCEFANTSTKPFQVVTDAFGYGISIADKGVASVNLFLMHSPLTEKNIHKKELKIRTLAPDEKITITRKMRGKQMYKSFTVSYLMENIHRDGTDYWTGKTKTKLLPVEPVN